MRLYLSGPITDTPNFRENFARDEAALRKAGFGVLNPLSIAACRDLSCGGAWISDADKVAYFIHTWQCNVKHDIAKFVFCDGIAMQDDWQKSKGARLENMIMVSLLLPSKSVGRWIFDAGE